MLLVIFPKHFKYLDLYYGWCLAGKISLYKEVWFDPRLQISRNKTKTEKMASYTLANKGLIC